jgi:hypothetical protein
MKFRISAVIVLALLASCTDAQKGKLSALSTKATVDCWSGPVHMYHGRSTGKVSPEDGGGGYFLKDSARAKLVEVSGSCVVEYDVK